MKLANRAGAHLLPTAWGRVLGTAHLLSVAATDRSIGWACANRVRDAAGRQLSLEAKSEVYGVLIQRSAATDAEVLANIPVKAITLDDVKAILKLYDRPAAPISITPSP